MASPRTISDADLIALREGGANISEIARRTGVNKATVSRRFKKMAEPGYGEEPSPSAPKAAGQKPRPERRPWQPPADAKQSKTKPPKPPSIDEQLTSIEVSLWETDAASEANYQAILKIRDGWDTTPGDKMRAAGLALQCQKFALDAAEKMYGYREVKAFIEGVLAYLDGRDPGAASEITAWLDNQAALSAAE